MKVSRKTVKFKVFNYKVRIVIAKDIRKYMSEHPDFSEVSMDGDDDDTNAITLHRRGDSVVIIPFSASFGTISHEAYHAVRKMLEAHDVELENEVVAYHLGYLVDQIHSVKDGR